MIGNTTVIVIFGVWSLIQLGITLFLAKALLALSERLSKAEGVLISGEQPATRKRERNIEDDVASGLIKGLQQMRTDDENHLKLLEMARKLQRTPMPIMNQNSASDESFNSGGDLIPANLTKEELDVLKMFYENKP